MGHESLTKTVSKEKGYYTSKNDTRERVITTKGWQHKIRYDKSWVSMPELKESNSLELLLG